MQFLHEFVLASIQFFTGLWPPFSPELKSPNFFLWGYLELRVYKNRPHTLEELKRNIAMKIKTSAYAHSRKWQQTW
ncbi:hypothetical protein C0J52_01190 [Blattella germanica]|nr:hypothetical protein C0J52_01190 [Blattella germanica]